MHLKIIALLCIFKLSHAQNATELDTEVALEWISKADTIPDNYVSLYLKRFLQVTRALMRELYSLRVSPNHEIAGRGNIVFSNRLPDRFLAIVQTGSHVGDDVLNAKDLIKHSKVMEQLKYLNINLFGETWTLNDICLTFPSPKVNGTFGDVVSNTLEDLVGCIIATPLDCFWEGSKVVGPNPPLQISQEVHTFIPSIPLGPMTWSNFNPEVVFEDVNKVVPVPKIKGLMKVAGVGVGYMDRLCIDPLDPMCPKTSPNYFDMCHLVDYYLKKIDPNTNLTAKYVESTEEQDTQIEEVPETDKKDEIKPELLVKNDTAENSELSDESGGTSATRDQYAVPDNVRVHNAKFSKGLRRVVRETGDYPDYGDYGISNESQEIEKLKKEAQKVCDERSPNVRLLLRRKPKIFFEYFREFSWPHYPKYGTLMGNGCPGFASNLLKWRSARVLGNIKKTGLNTITAEALQTFIKFPSAEQIYLRFKNTANRRHKTLDRRFWSVQRAQMLINTWSREAIKIVSTIPNFTALKMRPS